MARIVAFPRPGIVRGATPNASAGRWFDSNMMRFRGGVAQPVGGNAALNGTAFDGPGRDVLTWHDNSGKRWAAIGTDSKLWAYDFALATQYDITPAGVGPLGQPGAYDGYGLALYGSDAYGTARDPAQIGPADVSAILGDVWSMALFGQDLMIVPTQDGRLFRWSPNTPATRPVLNATAPVSNRGVFVTDERAVVLLGAGGDLRSIAWSDQENPNVWAASVANLAGSKELETEGRPLVGLRVTGGNLILTDNDAHLMTYVGPPYAYGVNKIAANCGPISPRAVGQAGGVTQWMSTQSFWKYSGSVVPVQCDVGDWLFSLINRSMIGRIFAAPNPSFTEQWWYWPGEASIECNHYVAQNYADPGAPWMIGRQFRTASDSTGAMIRPILAGPDNRLYMHEYGWLDNGASRIGTVYIETGDIQSSDGGDNRFHVRQIVQDYTGPDNAVGYRFFLFEETDGPQFDSGSIPISNATGLTDARFSCRGCRMRIEGLADVPFAIGKTRLLTRAGGSR